MGETRRYRPFADDDPTAGFDPEEPFLGTPAGGRSTKKRTFAPNFYT
jgi:hypothetical protein